MSNLVVPDRFVPEPLTVWKAQDLVISRDRGYIGFQGGGGVWLPGDPAVCRREAFIADWKWNKEPHEVPDPNCTCGYYACDSPDDALSVVPWAHVLVECKMWGRVCVGEAERGLAPGLAEYRKTRWAPVQVYRGQHIRCERIWMESDYVHTYTDNVSRSELELCFGVPVHVGAPPTASFLPTSPRIGCWSKNDVIWNWNDS